MAIESQASTLVFTSEEERLSAMNALEETPENEAKLDEIMNAAIKPKDEVADQKPTGPEEPQPPAEVAPAQKTEQPAPAAQPQSPEETFQIKKSDLPAGFDSPGKLLKSYQEAQALVERQQKFIKDRLENGNQDQSAKAIAARAEAAERELAELRKKLEAPAQSQTVQHNLSQIPESNAARIKSVRQKIQELSKDPISNETELLNARGELDDLWIAENERTNLLYERARAEAEEAKRQALEAKSTTEGWLQKSEQTESQRRAQEQLLSEYREIDDFAKDQKYSEFRMSKPASDVERDYVNWASTVTRLYYGAPVNIETPEGAKAMQQAMQMLQRGAPDIVEKCQLAGIPIQASDDIKKYLEICDLLEYRDGYRKDPVTGQSAIVKRYHAPTGQLVPDSFPSLSAAYEDRKIRDGYYEKRIRDAFAQGGKSMAQAITKPDQGAVEMDNASGVSSKDAGLVMSQQEARNAFNEIDEIEALNRKKAGDPSLYNRLSEAYRVLGMSLD